MTHKRFLAGLIIFTMSLSVAHGGGDNTPATLTFDQALSAQQSIDNATTTQVANTGVVTRNEDWTPQEQDFDGVMMVLVPAGCFDMGSTTGGNEEAPVHEQCFDTPFWIDKYEVTQAQFAEFGGQKANANYFIGDDLPVEQITWFEARDYCELRGGRLPTEREWEYVARGPNNLIYPWGNDFVADNVVYSANSNSQTANVGSRPEGVSWVGALDMSGNVWEWVSSLYGAYPYDETDESVSDNTSRRVLRGGSWGSSVGFVRSALRSRGDPTVREDVGGFRCVRSHSSSLTFDQDLVATQTAVAMQATEVANEPATEHITRNEDWTPQEQEFDGVTMVLVPAGCFMMGSTDAQIDVAYSAYATQYGESTGLRDFFEAESPQHEQCFDQPFWIDKYEVTQAQFAEFGGQKANANSFTGDELPVEIITWFEARDYCELRGGRLPTEREWEYAARGPNNLMYPWGNDFVADNVVYGGNNNSRTAPVGSRPEGVSWVGALDMSGNVWEWVSSLYQPYPYDETDESVSDNNIAHVLRGGSWDDTDVVVRSAGRDRGNPSRLRINYDGFRCVRSYSPSLTFDQDLVATQTAVAMQATEVADEPATEHITRNEDWTPQEQEFDGVTMVLVPAGCFMMGSTTGDSDEAPVHEQCFDTPFWIDKYEVTQAQFAEFGGQKADANYFAGDELPVEQITWFEARDYCELRGGRLPTEREWEYAARGPNNLTYPWGNDFVADNVVYSNNSNRRTAPVGSRAGGVSWVGAIDMSGNVLEWVSSLYGAYPYDETDENISNNSSVRVLRGGSWYSILTDVRSVYRGGSTPTVRGIDVGLRCVRSQE